MARAIYFGSDIQACDANGDPSPGAKLYAYLTATNTPTSMYAAAVGGSALANPVVADSEGRFVDIFLDVDITYRMKLTDAAGAHTFYDLDPVKAGVSSGYVTLAQLADDSPSGASLINTTDGLSVQDHLDAGPSLGIGLFTSFSGTPPVIDSAVKQVYSSGHWGAGLGIARYIQDNAVDGTYVAAHPRTSFLDAGGLGWRIDLEQPLTAPMFGIRNDHFTTNTDNLAAILEAIETVANYDPYTLGGGSVAWWKFGGEIYFPPGGYYLSGTLDIHRIITLKGAGKGHNASGTGDATEFYFPTNTTGIRIHSSNTDTTVTDTVNRRAAQGAIIDGITLRCAAGSDVTKHGFQLRTRATLRNCCSFSFPGDAFHIEATAGSGGSTEGNCNGWFIDHCFACGAGRHGLFISGSDANAGLSIAFETAGTVGGCGILDTSGLGNTHVAFDIGSYGNKGVTQGGRYYQLIVQSSLNQDPTSNPNIWYDLGVGSATTQFPAWSSATTYTASCPLMVPEGASSTASAFVGGYVEGATILSHISGPAARQFGGTWNCTNRSMNDRGQSAIFGSSSPRLSNYGYGSYQAYFSGSTNYTAFGDHSLAAVGHAPGTIFMHEIGLDSARWALRHSGADIIYDKGATDEIYRVTGPGTTKQFGTGANVTYAFAPKKFVLTDPTDSTNDRLMRYGTGAPASGAHARGEFVWNSAPSAAGTLGWTCVTAGTPGTWKAVSGIAA